MVSYDCIAQRSRGVEANLLWAEAVTLWEWGWAVKDGVGGRGQPFQCKEPLGGKTYQEQRVQVGCGRKLDQLDGWG